MPKPGEFTIETKRERALRLIRVRLQMRLDRQEFAQLCGWSTDFTERMETAALHPVEGAPEDEHTAAAKGAGGSGEGEPGGRTRDPSRPDPFKGQRLSHNLLMRALFVARFPLEALDLIPQGYSAHPILASKLERYREALDEWAAQAATETASEAQESAHGENDHQDNLRQGDPQNGGNVPVRGRSEPYRPTEARKPSPYEGYASAEEVRAARARRIKHIRFQTGLSRKEFALVCDWFDGYWNILRPGLKRDGYEIPRENDENLNEAWIRIIEDENVTEGVGRTVPLSHAQELAALFFARYPKETLRLMGAGKYQGEPELASKVERYNTVLQEWNSEEAALS